MVSGNGRHCSAADFPNFYAMAEAAEAIRGHKSAHSFATGPVIALPFISPFGFTITPALSVIEYRHSLVSVLWCPRRAALPPPGARRRRRVQRQPRKMV